MADTGGVSGLVSQPLGPSGGLNYVYLIELVVCVILSVFFLFYFNRLFATLLSYIVRAYTWHRYHAYIDITSLQVSLLGGRIFFKSIRYHGHNETIYIHDGRLTWRYWLYKVQKAQAFQEDPGRQRHGANQSEKAEFDGSQPRSDAESSSDSSQATLEEPQELPCRLHLRVSGVEAFLYNRTPVYDDILSNFRSVNDPKKDPAESLSADHVSIDMSDGDKHKAPRTGTSSSGANPHTLYRQISEDVGPQRKPLPSYLRSLPVQIECKKAAAAIGNENTTSIMVAKAEQANGRIDVARSGPLDLYKILIMFDVKNVILNMKPNVDFKHKQHEAAANFATDDALDIPNSRRRPRYWLYHTLAPLRSLCRRMMRLCSPPRLRRRNSVTINRGSDAPAMTDPSDRDTHWHGLARFLDDDDNPNDLPDPADAGEYARLSSLADCSLVRMKLYWDVPGILPSDTSLVDRAPPDYGLDLTLHESTINYGPWADRQRIILQNIFFPQSFVDYTMKAKLLPGQARYPTSFKLNMMLKTDVTLRIPFRESSKDWRYRNQDKRDSTTSRATRSTQRKKDRSQPKKVAARLDARPFAWVDLVAKKGSTVHYTMDQAGLTGKFINSLQVSLTGAEVSTSINHGLFMTTEVLSITGDLSVPLEWNALRCWAFDVKCEGLDLYILRDHMFLITDLVSDWSTGPPADYHTMVPFRYHLDLQLEQSTLILNTNDANVIDNPTSRADNNFLALRIANLRAVLAIPMDTYRPVTSCIPFDVTGSGLSLELQSPPRVTFHHFLKETKLATLTTIILRGTHTYFTEQSTALTDVLKMSIEAKSLRLTLFGVLMRHLVNLKENYFGDFIHYKTSQELQNPDQNPTSTLEEAQERYNFRPSNDLDVLLDIIVKDPVIHLPTRLYSPGQVLELSVPVIYVDLRVTNYYLDLQLDVPPLDLVVPSRTQPLSDNKISIDGFALQGHRLFGLPPIEPAYISTWNVNVGLFSGSVSAAALASLLSAGEAFTFTMADAENAIPLIEVKPEPDVVFLKLTMAGVVLHMPMDDHTLGITTDPFVLDFDDAPTTLLGSSRMSTFIPTFRIICAANKRSGRHENAMLRFSANDCDLLLQTSISITLWQSDGSVSAHRYRQQLLLRTQDARTKRASFLTTLGSADANRSQEESHNLPAMFPPTLSEPIPSPRKTQSHVVQTLNGIDACNESVSDATSSDSGINTAQSRVTLLLQCEPGIRGKVDSGLLSTVMQFAKDLQPDEPEEVLDAFQTSVLQTVSSQSTSRRRTGSTFDFRFNIPLLDLRLFVIPTPSRGDSFDLSHELSLSLHQVVCSGRLASKIATAESAGTNMHLSIDALSLVAESIDSSNGRHHELLRIDGETALFWCLLSNKSTIHVSLDVLTAAVSSKDPKAIVLLAMRCAAIVDTASDFALSHKQQSLDRIKRLIKTIDAQRPALDAPHLGRLPYVLRVCPDHVRSKDSWRMLVRIRHSFKSIAPQNLEGAWSEITRQDTGAPLNEARELLDRWTHWCTWDVPDPEASQVYRSIFGSFNIDDEYRGEQYLIVAHTGTVRVVLESKDTKDGDIFISEHVTQVSILPPDEPAQLVPSLEKPRSTVVVHSTTEAVLLNLRWSMINLIEPLFQAMSLYPTAIRKPGLARPNSPGDQSNIDEDLIDIQGVAHIENASFNVSSPHLQLASAAYQLRASVLRSTASELAQQSSMTALLNAESCRLDLTGDPYHIASIDVYTPSVFFGRTESTSMESSSLDLGVTYDNILFKIEQEPLDLVPLIIKVIHLEVAQISHLINRPDREDSLGHNDMENTRESSKVNIKAVLLAGPYTLDVALFNGVKQIIHGQAWNLLIASETTRKVKLAMTLEPVMYSIKSLMAVPAEIDTTITTPAVIIAVDLSIDKPKTSVTGSVVIDKTRVKAAVLYNIIVMLRDAEAESWLTAANEAVADIRQHVTKVNDKVRQHVQQHREPRKSVQDVGYDVQIYNAGLSVIGTSPLPHDPQTNAELLLGIDPVEASIRSRSDADGNSSFPVVALQLAGLYTKLQVARKGQQARACGHARIGLIVRLLPEDGMQERSSSGLSLEAKSDALDVELSVATAPVLVALVTHIDHRVNALALHRDINQLRKIRFRKHIGWRTKADAPSGPAQPPAVTSGSYMPSIALRLDHIRLVFLAEGQRKHLSAPHDLELTINRIDLTTKGIKAARLAVHDSQLKLLSHTEQHHRNRPAMAAALPEIVLDVSLYQNHDRWRIDFNATGETLNLHVQARVCSAVATLRSSTRRAVQQYKDASATWRVFQRQKRVQDTNKSTASFNPSKIEGLRMHVKFAGAVLHLQSSPTDDHQKTGSAPEAVVVRAPGVAVHVEYSKTHQDSQDSSLFMDVQVQASSNTVSPDLVPFVLQLSSDLRAEMQKEQNDSSAARMPGPDTDREATSFLANSSVLASNAAWAKSRVSLGLRIGRQEFQLDCQPVARIKANVQIDDIYITAHTIEGALDDRLFSVSASLTGLSTSVSHMYSRAATVKFGMDSLNVSVMSDKHRGAAATGLLVSVLIEPMQSTINARQIQDVLIFRDVWLPGAGPNGQETAPSDAAGDEYFIQRYHQMATAAAFPWDVIIALEAIDVDVDFGQSIGKHRLIIHDLWARSTKNAASLQELYLGLEKVDVNCTGRMGGIFELHSVRIKSSIQWPHGGGSSKQTPLVTTNVSLERLRLKASFEFQPFAFADIDKFYFQMFNVRSREMDGADRLVAVLDGEHVLVFCTATSPAQALGLYQAFERLVKEKQAAYSASKREMMNVSTTKDSTPARRGPTRNIAVVTPGRNHDITLRSRVIVTLGQISFGAFPTTFLDHQVFKLDASKVRAEAFIGVENARIRSDLSLSLGQLEVALAAVRRLSISKTLADVTVSEVIEHGVGATGGIILRVPRVVASMQSWQEASARKVDYIFRSTFEGKVDVGWNYARIGYIRDMWNTHTRSLAARLGKSLPDSAVRITASADRTNDQSAGGSEDEAKITAIINMPAARYEYHALVEPIIETPQLRDMGEATPPLEWIGLNRERLPSVVHQVVIMAMLEVAKEVEGAYGRILGASANGAHQDSM